MAVKALHLDGVPTALRIRQAVSWWARLVGLLATPALDDPCGLWIAPCNSVHTIGMRYPIDVVFVRADGKIARVVENLKPFRGAVCMKSQSTLELRAGLARQLRLQPGMTVALAD